MPTKQENGSLEPLFPERIWIEFAQDRADEPMRIRRWDTSKPSAEQLPYTTEYSATPAPLADKGLAGELAGLIENRNDGNSARWNKMIAAWTGKNAAAILAALSRQPVEVDGWQSCAEKAEALLREAREAITALPQAMELLRECRPHIARIAGMEQAGGYPLIATSTLHRIDAHLSSITD